MVTVKTVILGTCSLCGYVGSLEKFKSKDDDPLTCPACNDGKNENYSSWQRRAGLTNG